MSLPIKPLQVESLKDACISRLEQLILSGELRAGEHLPAERDLAIKLGVSRPVLHEALVDLAAKGLVTILPRRGVEVNDFRQSGSMAILSSLLNYHNGEFDSAFTNSLFEMRLLVEVETARLAALKANPAQLSLLDEIAAAEKATDRNDIAALTKLDFDFHLQIAIASQNHIYPLILNSFNAVYTHFTGLFFKDCHDCAILDEVFAFHQRLTAAIRQHEPNEAARSMTELLTHGSQHLLEQMQKSTKKE
jgi:GntR family transcriptional regulator, transcriptional repressor for pyruvate dehydrogenase complex